MIRAQAGGSAILNYATPEEMIAAELANKPAPPSGVDVFYKNRTAHIPVLCPESTVADGTQAFLDAVTAARNVNGLVRLTFAQKKVRLYSGLVNLDFGNVMFASDNGTEIIANDPDGDHPINDSSLITATGTGRSEAYTTLAVPITDPRNTYEIEVADVMDIAAGEVILIASQSTDDYFYGVSGQNGFSPVKNAEMVTVRQVTTGHLLLAEALSYTYSTANGGTRIYRMDMLPNIRLSGLRGTGLGYGPGGTWDGLGPGFISANNVDGFSMVDCDGRRFGSWALRATNVRDAHITRGKILGLDYSDPNLDGQATDNYGAVSFNGCKRVYVSHIHAQGVRHPIDVSTTNGNAVSNIVSFVSCSGDGYLTAGVAGTHIADNATFIDYTTRRGGIYMRGKNWAIIGCNINTSEADANGIAAGSGESARPYPETPDMGICRVIGNKVRSATGIELRNSCSGMIVANNEFDCSAHGFYAFGKSFKDFIFTGNMFDLTRRVASVRYGIYFDSITDIELQTLENILIQGNVFKNVSAMAYVMGTNSMTTPAEGVVIQHNIMAGTAYTPSNAVLFPGATYYGEKLIVDDIKAVGTVPTTALVLNAEPGYYRRRPQFSNYQPLAPRNIGYSPSLPAVDGTTVSLFDTYQISPAGALKFCTVAGTVGATTGSITGSIGSGTAALTLSGCAAFDVMPGMYLSIAGAGAAAAALVARVLSITETVAGNATAASCVLDTNASTTVAGNAVTYRNPTWV